MVDRVSGESLCYGFAKFKLPQNAGTLDRSITMSDSRCTDAAKRALNGKTLKGSKVLAPRLLFVLSVSQSVDLCHLPIRRRLNWKQLLAIGWSVDCFVIE